MPEQTTQAPHEVVKAFVAARNARDRERMAAVMTEDVELVLPASHELGTFRGAAAIDALAGGLTGSIFDLSTVRREVKRITAEGDVVVVEQRMTATTLEGKDYANEYVWIYELRDGRIARLFEHADTLTLARLTGRA